MEESKEAALLWGKRRRDRAATALYWWEVTLADPICSAKGHLVSRLPSACGKTRSASLHRVKRPTFAFHAVQVGRQFLYRVGLAREADQASKHSWLHHLCLAQPPSGVPNAPIVYPASLRRIVYTTPCYKVPGTMGSRNRYVGCGSILSKFPVGGGYTSSDDGSKVRNVNQLFLRH